MRSVTLIATNKKSAKIRLAELRHERELTQKELANIIGIDPSTIANYEVGSRSPDYFTNNRRRKPTTLVVGAVTLSISFYSVFCPGE